MNPKIAQTLYALGTVVTSVVGIALLWGGVDAGTANGIGQIVGGLGVLFGGTPQLGLATARTGRQINTGTLGSPEERVIAGLNELAATKVAAETSLSNITNVAQDVLGVIPGGAALQSDIAAAVKALGVNAGLFTPPAATG